jgi:hypothetical protein
LSVALTLAAVALGASKFAWRQTYAGITCAGITIKSVKDVACQKAKGKGYTVILNKDAITVLNSKGRFVLGPRANR